MRTLRTGIGSILFFVLTFSGYARPIEVGKWRTHFAPSAIVQLAERDAEVFGVMASELLYVDTRDNALYEMDRTHGLSNTGLSAAAYNPMYDVLLVGYTDGMLDFVYGDDVVSNADIQKKDLGTDKRIWHIVMDGRYAYIGTSFGWVVADMKKEEIRETYFIGENNTYLPVYHIATDEQYFYAATPQGLKYARRNSANLNDYAAWISDSAFKEKSIRYCVSAYGRVMFSDGTQLYSGDAEAGWRMLRNHASDEVSAMAGYTDAWVVAFLDTASRRGRVEVLDREARVLYSTAGLDLPEIRSSLIDARGDLWIGTVDGRMICIDMANGRRQSYAIDGPCSDQCFDLSATGKSITMVRGGFDETFRPLTTPFGASIFSGETWTVFDSQRMASAGFPPEVRAATQMVEDPMRPGHFFVSTSSSGLIEIEPDGTIKRYHAGNSLLQNNMSDQKDCRVYGLDFDAAGNLWILNALTTNSLVALQRDGTWKSFDMRVANNVEVARPRGLLVDYWQQKWVIFANTQLAVFKTDGNSIQGLKVDLNNGNTLKTSSVFCLAEDDLGHVWIGTDRGVKVIDQHARMFESPQGGFSSVSTKTIKVPKDGFLIELLNTDQVKAIAVDGGNRKWLGTASNGVYLVSADGMDEICHFTVENSPLLSNTIVALAIDDRTGEVFIGTDKGLVSYRGTATRTEGDPKEEARAFPNPIRPGYEGLINIKGLPQNAIVKITDTKGNLIFQERATGGQLSWDGRGMRGQRPASGVLFVFACKEDGSQKLACKIFYIR